MRTLLILTAVAVALGGYIVCVDRARPGTDQARTDRHRLFPGLSRAAVTEARLQGKGGPALVFVRAGTSWRSVDPDQPADGAALDELLTELEVAEIDRGADVTLAAAGLNPPAFSVELQAGPQRFHLRGGRGDPIGRGVYVQRVGDADVLVAPRRLLELAGRDASVFRDRRLVPDAALTDAVSLTWVAPEGDASIRLEAGRWRNGQHQWVSRARVVETLRRLLALKADRFVAVAPDAGTTGGRNLEVALSNGTTWSLRGLGVACSDPALVAVERTRGGSGTPAPAGAKAGGAGEALCLPQAAWDAFWTALPGAAHQDGKVITAAAGEITSFEIAEGDRRLALRRETPSSPWLFVAPAVAYQPDRQDVDAWLTELGAMGLGAVASARSAGSPPRRLTVTSLFTEELALAVNARSASGVTVSRAGETTSLVGPARLLELTTPEPLRFRSRQLLSFARYDAQRVRVTGARTEEAVKAPSEDWRLVQPAGAALDQAALDELLGAATNLRALRFLTAQGGRPFRPTHTLEVSESDERGARAVTHRIAVAAPSSNGECLARIGSEADAEFLIAADTCADLRRSLLMKKAPP